MNSSTNKPRYLWPDYARQFEDRGVAAAYRHRHPYPDEVLDFLSTLAAQRNLVLDLGCGTGDLARPLATRFRAVAALDPSAAMIEVGQSLPGGTREGLQWICATAEDCRFPEHCDLATAGESLHWMDWEQVLPKVGQSLTAEGMLAILTRRIGPTAWQAAEHEIIRHFSTNRDYAPFNMLEELHKRGLFRQISRRKLGPTPVRQSVDDYIERRHSQNGFARETMGAAAAEHDEALRNLLRPHADEGMLELDLFVTVVWGRPAAEARSDVKD